MEGEALCRHLSQNTLRTSSEFQLLVCVNKWLHAAPARMATDAPRCLQNIRFGLMSEAELSMAHEQDAIQRCPGNLGPQLTRKGYQYHTDSKKGHPVVDKFCQVRATGPSLIMVHHGTSFMPFQVTAYNHAAALFYSLFSDVNGSRDCRVASIDNFAYVCRIVDFGGGTLMSSLFRFDPRHLVGQELRPMRHLRLEFSLVAYDSCLYAFGGSTEQFAILDSVETYNVKTNLWEELLPLPSPTHSLAAVTHANKIYLSGGVSGQERQTTNSFVCFDPVARSYQVLPGMMYARRLHEMVALQDKIFVLGGIPKTGVPLYGQIPIESYALASRQWTMLSSTLSGRSIGHYTNFEGQILALGHEHSTATEDEIWTFDPDLDDWFRYAKAPQRMSLNSAMCTQLCVNYNDEKICQRFMKEK